MQAPYPRKVVPEEPSPWQGREQEPSLAPLELHERRNTPQVGSSRSS